MTERAADAAVSNSPTPYAVICAGDPDIGYVGCGRVYMTEAEYLRQLNRPDSLWTCPSCSFGEAYFDDETFEAAMGEDDDDAE